VTDEVLRITKTCNLPGLIIVGDIDESTYSYLMDSLAALPPAGDVHVDLGGVEFCDLAGLRAIVCLTGCAGDGIQARRVVLHAVPPRLKKILDILGWDVMPGLAFDGEATPPPGGAAALRPAEMTPPGGRDAFQGVDLGEQVVVPAGEGVSGPRTCRGCW